MAYQKEREVREVSLLKGKDFVRGLIIGSWRLEVAERRDLTRFPSNEYCSFEKWSESTRQKRVQLGDYPVNRGATLKVPCRERNQ